MKIRRLLLLTMIIAQLSISNSFSQSGEWAWMKGDSTGNGAGSYGIKGIPSPANEPGSRYASAFWTDTAGNFWVFSGLNASDDLWMFNPGSLTWTWMTGSGSLTTDTEYITGAKGVYSAQNSPGQLFNGIMSWLTPDNHLWLFGGLKEPGAISNDLWQYDPAINQWAWMGTFGPVHYGTPGQGDSTTMPGGRYEGNCAWTDSLGNLWLFGGINSLGTANNIWQYNTSTGTWTWMSGSPNNDDPGSYGVIGQPSVSHYPAGRTTNLFWKDDAGNFWLAGGTRFGTWINFQDVWNFNPQTLQWTWVKGPAGVDTLISGAQCTPGTANQSGPRYENRANWKVCDDLVITIGGFDRTDYFFSILDDMWAYKPLENEWIEINTGDSAGHYGIQGLAGAANYPPARYGPLGFTDKHNNLWLFAGYERIFYNDLWQYVPDTTCVGSISCNTRSCNLAPPVITASDSIFCSSDSAAICAPTGFASYQWNPGVTGTGRCIEATAAGDYYVLVTDTNGCTAFSNHLPVSTYPVPQVSITQHGDTLTSFGAVSYQWILNNQPLTGDTGSTCVANRSGSYTVQITDTNGCTTTGSPVLVSTGIDDLAEGSISLYPNPSVGNWALAVDNSLLGSALEIYDEQGRLVFKSKIQNSKSEITAPMLASGVYYLRISNAATSVVRKLVKL